jgi:hypothetical protein
MSVPTGPAAVTRRAARVLLLDDADRLLPQREHFLLARVTSATVDTGCFNDIERRTVLGHRWWSATELAATTEVVYPPELAELLPALVAGEVPDPPLVLSG